MTPVIGLTCNHDPGQEIISLSRNYTRAVATAGGMPLIFDISGGEMELKNILRLADAVVLTGGGDVDPVFIDEEPLPGCGNIDPERDFFEIALARLLLSAGLPVLGICRGMQVLNIAAGGDVFQDITSRQGEAVKHYQEAPRWHPTHNVQVAGGTMLERITGGGRIRVNSFHHQAVRNIAPGFTVSARSADGVAEAIEHPGLPFALGVQFHPETMWERNKLFLALFEALVKAAADRKK
jgi:putative glutamine amidotransferase